MSKYIRFSLFFLLLVTSLGFAQHDHQARPEERLVAGDAYPFGYCVVSREKLGTMGKPVVYAYYGRELRFCCSSCIPRFNKSPHDYLKKLNAAIVQQQLPFYPLDVCLVSGKKLGSMGDPFDYVHNNRLVRFCCRGCLEKFLRSAEKYLADLDNAVIRKQKTNYPLTTCLVSGEKLGNMGEAVNFVHGNRLLRFCCRDCIKKFRSEPLQYLAKLDKAGKK